MPIMPPSMQRETIFRNAAPFAGFEIPKEEGPWIPGEPGILNRFLLIDLKNNSFVTLVKCAPGSGIALHFHTAAVVGFTLQGMWKYREHDWIARPGSFVYEPAGEHTRWKSSATSRCSACSTWPRAPSSTPGPPSPSRRGIRGHPD